MKTNVFLACLFAFLKATAVALISFWLLMLISNDVIHAHHGETYLVSFFMTLFFYPLAVLVYVVSILLPGYFILKKRLPESDWFGFFKMLVPFSMLLITVISVLILISVPFRDFTEPLMLINIINGYVIVYTGALFFSRDIYKFAKKF